MVTIRNEQKTDYKIVEEITRKAFYNVYIEGCVEHYLVHIMRQHEDFIPELDLVIELDGKVIGNYVSCGFKGSKKYNVCIEGGKYPTAMMVKELVPNSLDGRKWFYYDSPVMAIDEAEAQQYDDTLKKMEKKYQPSQDEFYIMSHSFVE